MFDNQQNAFIAVSDAKEICIVPKMANRHGLITGATGTGKTVTLQNMAETFSQMGVPVFAADVKGDLSGVAAIGGNKESVVKRVSEYGLSAKGFSFQAFPVQFWDVFGDQGIPVRATIADMGPLLLGRLLALNDTQSAVLTAVFKIAADQGLELVDLKDLRLLLEYAAANKNDFATRYGNISPASIGAIQRGLVTLEHEGGESFFGEPALQIEDLMQTEGGKGVINILAADKLVQSPKMYTTFLLWLMTKLFDVLPEVGDAPKPPLIFFFDEAHLLFSDAPKALLEKVEQVVRLIRSKGVGIYFVSQTPSDIPDSVLGQLGNRVQHALRAYTPKDQKSLRAAAQSFRPNPAFDTESAIAELGTGEALLSFLDDKGAPMPVERGFILPPEGQIGPLDESARQAMIQKSPLYRVYGESQDRHTAYEALTEKMQERQQKQEEAVWEKARAAVEKQQEKERQQAEKLAQKEADQSRRFWGGIAKSILTPFAKQLSNVIFKRK